MIILKITREKISAMLFFVIAEFMYGFELTFIQLPKIFSDFLLFIVICLFITSFSLSKWNTWQLLKIVFLLAIGVCVYISSGETLYIVIMMAIIVMNNISYKDAANTIFWTRLIITLLIVTLSIVGVLPLNKMTVPKGKYGSAIGYGLGYTHPNGFAVSIFLLCILYLCINYKKLSNMGILGIIFIEILTYEITKSKSTFGTLLFVCLLLLFRRNELVSKIVRFVSLPYTLIIMILAIFVPMLYTYATGGLQRFVYQFNSILNGRFMNASNMFLSFPITAFGKIINTDYLQNMFGYNVVDNGYVFLLFNYGVIGCAVMIFLYIYAIKSLLKKDNLIFVLVIVAFLTVGMMENIIRSMAMNVTVIFLYEFINNEKDIVKRTN